MIKTASKNLKNYKKGNTLAEMLITIAIIGIVFTVSVGVFVADYNRNQTVVRLEKMYSTLSQAFNKSMVTNGMLNSWDFPDNLSEIGSYTFFEDYLKPSLILARDCKNSTKGQCDFVFKELDGSEKSLNSTWVRFFLNDGAFVAMQTNANDKYKVIYFYADTNGKKRLNVVARDIFLFEYWIQNNDHPEYVGKLLPFGHQYTREEITSTDNYNNCNSSTNGNYCGALIMKDNWQIKTGYPWAQARYVVK